MSVYWLAEKLGKFVHEVEELTPNELAEYLAYFKLKMEEEKKEADKARRARTTKGRPRKR